MFLKILQFEIDFFKGIKARDSRLATGVDRGLFMKPHRLYVIFEQFPQKERRTEEAENRNAFLSFARSAQRKVKTANYFTESCADGCKNSLLHFALSTHASAGIAVATRSLIA